MKYINSKELANKYKEFLDSKGIKQQFVADAMGITKQTLQHKFNKKALTFDDLQELLAPIGYELQIEFIPVHEQGE